MCSSVFFCVLSPADPSDKDHQAEIRRCWSAARGFAKGPWDIKGLLCEVLQLSGGALNEFVVECITSHWPELTNLDEDLRSTVHSARGDGNWNVFHLEAVCRKLGVQMLLYALDEGRSFVIGERGPMYHLLGHQGEYMLVQGRTELWSGRTREATPTNPPQFSGNDDVPQPGGLDLEDEGRREEYERLVQLSETAVFPTDDSGDVLEPEAIPVKDQAELSKAAARKRLRDFRAELRRRFSIDLPSPNKSRSVSEPLLASEQRVLLTESDEGQPKISRGTGVVRPVDTGFVTIRRRRPSPPPLPEERILQLRSRQITIQLPYTGHGTYREPNNIGYWEQMDARELPLNYNIKLREPRRPLCEIEDGGVRCHIPHCPSPQRTFGSVLAWKRHVLATRVHQEEGYCHQCGLQLAEIPSCRKAAKTTLKVHRRDECYCATAEVKNSRRRRYEEYKAAGIELGHIYVPSMETSEERRRPAPCSENVTIRKRRRSS